MKLHKYIGTSWKMNKTLQDAVDYVTLLKNDLENNDNTTIFLVVPFTHLWKIKEMVKDTNILVGAQNMHWQEFGAFTGEISPIMLKEIGIDLVELGHSERRQFYNENDYDINKKVLAALKQDIMPLICVGEQLVHREFKLTQEVISCQIKIALNKVKDEDFGKIWIAYEPVWAIGEGGTPALPEEVSEVHLNIRQILNELYGINKGPKIPILYGGSVNISNCNDLLQQEEVDGLFLGRSALEPGSFLDIINTVRDI
jgi:L-erythrulose 1-phosphate isomerase